MQPVAKTSEPRLSTVHGFIPYNPAEWTRLRADLAARDRGETGAEDAS